MRFVASIVIVALGATAAHAESPGVPHLQPVYVAVQDSPVELRGRVIDLSRDRLALLIDGSRRDLPLDRVVRIQVDGDPVRDGAIIGAIIGGALSLAALRRAGASTAIAFTTMNVAVWAALGTAIDAMIPGRRTVYAQGTLRF